MPIANIFKRLAGLWAFEREIINQAQAEFSGMVTGTAVFTPITEDIYQCIESGVFTTHSQQKFTVSKEFLYCFNGAKQAITVHAAQNQQSTGELFELRFPSSLSAPLVCNSRHLCAKDIYDGEFSFPDDMNFTNFKIKYSVEGPAKSYTSTTNFIKPS